MDKPAADYFKRPSVPLAGFMPRKAPGKSQPRDVPRGKVYDLSNIPAARVIAKRVSAPIKTVQAGASLRKDRAATSAEFGKLLRRRVRAKDPFVERLNRLSGA